MNNDSGLQAHRASRPTTRTRLPRGFWGQVWLIIFQPRLFFRALAPDDTTRSWLGIAILVLGLTGFSYVRHEALIKQDPLDRAGQDQVAAITEDDAFTDQFSTGLKAAGVLVMYWLVQSFLLAEVPLLTGRSPRFGKNVQLVIWASLPLGIMAGLQVIYYTAGGAVGAEGISGVVNELPGYADYSSSVQTFIRSAAEQFTLFWVWSLMLLYFGARYTLHGNRWASLLILAIWVPLAIFLPAALGI